MRIINTQGKCEYSDICRCGLELLIVAISSLVFIFLLHDKVVALQNHLASFNPNNYSSDPFAGICEKHLVLIDFYLNYKFEIELDKPTNLCVLYIKYFKADLTNDYFLYRKLFRKKNLEHERVCVVYIYNFSNYKLKA